MVSHPLMPTSYMRLMVLFPAPPQPTTFIFAFCCASNASSSASTGLCTLGNDCFSDNSDTVLAFSMIECMVYLFLYKAVRRFRPILNFCTCFFFFFGWWFVIDVFYFW